MHIYPSKSPHNKQAPRERQAKKKRPKALSPIILFIPLLRSVPFYPLGELLVCGVVYSIVVRVFALPR